MEGFLVQVLAGIASTVVGTLLVTLILPGTRREHWDPVKVRARNGRGGTQVVFGDRVEGDVNVDADNSRKIVVQNIESSKPPATSSDVENHLAWFMGAIAVVAAGLFVLYSQFVLWFVFGIALGVALVLVAGWIRASRFRLWDGRGIAVTLEVCVSLVVIVWSCISVSTLRFSGVTIAELGRRVSAAVASEPGSAGVLNAVARFIFEPIKQLAVLGFANGQLTFAIMMLACTVISLLLAMMCWQSLYDWLTYMGFIFGTTTNARTAKRAARFESRTFKSIFPTLVLCAVACLLASGWLLTVAGSVATPTQVTSTSRVATE